MRDSKLHWLLAGVMVLPLSVSAQPPAAPASNSTNSFQTPLMPSAPPVDDNSAHADESTNSPGLEVTVRKETSPGAPQRFRVFVGIATNQITFLVPDGYSLERPNGRQVALANADSDSFILCRLIEPATSNDSELAQVCRTLLPKIFPGAVIKRESTAHAGDGTSGPQFEFHWIDGRNLPRAGRAAFVPNPAGILAFAAVSKPGNLRAAEDALYSVLLTLRVNALDSLSAVEPEPAKH